MSSLVLTVSQLNAYIKSLLDGDAHLQHVFLQGEISNFTNHYRTGHYYMTLKDEGAAVQAVMFRSAACRLKFMPENGMKVLARGRVSLFEKSGQYQIYLDDLQPDGAGALQLAFEQIRRRLQAEGLFDEGRKRPIPPMPSVIGIITSPTGAALQDIRTILFRRFPAARLIFCPTLVQGEQAPEQIVRAIRRMNEQTDADVIILGRGGGSLEDLWAFNDERVARAVAGSRIPVISAVGHETDFTICDFAADLRAPTPSAAAELAVPDRLELTALIASLRSRMKQGMSAQLNTLGARVTRAKESRVLSSPMALLESRRMRLDFQSDKMLRAFGALVAGRRAKFAALCGELQGMSPLRVLSRGYAVASVDDRVVVSASALRQNDRISVRFRDGSADCLVERVEMNPPGEGENEKNTPLNGSMIKE